MGHSGERTGQRRDRPRRRTELPTALAARAAAQHGMLTRRQLVTAVGRAGLRALLATGTVDDGGHRGVYRVAGSSRTRRQQLAAVLLRMGRGAVAANETALALHEVDGFSLMPPYHVAIPVDRRVANPPCRVIHATLAEHETTTAHGLAVMTVERALLPLAEGGLDKPARSTIDAILRDGHSTRRRLAASAAAHPSHPGAAVISRAFGDGVFEHDSEGERHLARLFRPGDPQPVWQVWVLPDVRADGALPPARMTLEWNSRRWHLQAGDQDRDAQRRLKLVAADIEEIVVTAGMLRDEPEQTRRRILQVYAQRVAAGVEPLTPCDPPPWVR